MGGLELDSGKCFTACQLPFDNEKPLLLNPTILSDILNSPGIEVTQGGQDFSGGSRFLPANYAVFDDVNLVYLSRRWTRWFLISQSKKVNKGMASGQIIIHPDFLALWTRRQVDQPYLRPFSIQEFLKSLGS
ncbi:hypothetical protein ES707_16497 [subsurface metagenome]